jgi:hypothetical protein
MGKVTKSDLAFIWINALIFGLAANWTLFAQLDALPLKGLVKIANERWISWPAFLGMLFIAIYVSISQWRTRDGLLVISGILGCAAFVGMFYVSPGVFMSLCFISGPLYRQNKSA